MGGSLRVKVVGGWMGGWVVPVLLLLLLTKATRQRNVHHHGVIYEYISVMMIFFHLIASIVVAHGWGRGLGTPAAPHSVAYSILFTN
jgi:hypothetical protein